MSKDRIDDARGIFRVLETGDIALARRVASPSFSNREAAVAPPACALPGPAGLLASSAWMRAAFSRLHFELLEVDAADTHVWVRLRMQGHQTGPFVQFSDGRPARVLPPTGRPIDFEQVHLLEVDDTGVLRHEAVRDDMTMLGQLGVLPPGAGFLLSGLAYKVTARERRAVGAVVAATELAAAEGASTAPAP